MIENIRMLAAASAVTAIIISYSPVRTFAHETAGVGLSSEENFISEFSARTKTSAGKSQSAGNKTRHASKQGHAGKTKQHTPPRTKHAKSKPLGSATSKTSMPAGSNKTNTGAAGSMSSGPGKGQTGAADTGKGKLQEGPGKAKSFADKNMPDPQNPKADPKQDPKKDPKKDPKDAKNPPQPSNPPVVVVMPTDPQIRVIDGVPPASVFSPGPRQLPPPSTTAADCIRIRTQIAAWEQQRAETNGDLAKVQQDVETTRSTRDARLAAATTPEEKQSIMQGWQRDLAEYAGQNAGYNNVLRMINGKIGDLKAQQVNTCE